MIAVLIFGSLILGSLALVALICYLIILASEFNH